MTQTQQYLEEKVRFQEISAHFLGQTSSTSNRLSPTTRDFSRCGFSSREMKAGKEDCREPTCQQAATKLCRRNTASCQQNRVCHVSSQLKIWSFHLLLWIGLGPALVFLLAGYCSIFLAVFHPRPLDSSSGRSSVETLRPTAPERPWRLRRVSVVFLWCFSSDLISTNYGMLVPPQKEKCCFL